MDLTRADFATFFAELHDGHAPFEWQERLLHHLLINGGWPDRIVAPTGSGKTAVIDAHVFALALSGNEQTPRLPRRLSMVVARRVLVDDQHEYAHRLAAALVDAESPVMQAVAERLWRLRLPGHADPIATAGVSPVVVGRLRGGQLPSRAWKDYPTAATVLCSTPDMWGSRLLFRGYGSGWKAWPREAGLLAFDSAVVVDEAHLSQQFLRTARRVAQLATVADSSPRVPTLQVVETTATPTGPGPYGVNGVHGSIGVEPGDLSSAALADRLTRPKPVTLLPVHELSSTTGPARRTVSRVMADTVLGLLGAARTDAGAMRYELAGTVGCFVNTVNRAIDVTDALRRMRYEDRPLRVVMICGQIRPHDLDRLRASYPGVLSVHGNDDVDVIVATQSLEVGVDLDLAGLVTELASGSALAQRAGRVNRRGLRTAAPITVVVPNDEITERTRSGPYDHTELSAALEWVTCCAGTSGGMAPWNLRSLRPPTSQSKRMLLQRPELADAWLWARTTDDLAAEPDLDLWLVEGFEPDTSIGVVVRSHLPTESSDALRLVMDLPPMQHEVFPVPYGTAVRALRRWGVESRHLAARPSIEEPTAIVLRGDDVSVLAWRDARDDAPGDTPVIRPGDVVILDASVSLFTSSVAGATGGFSPPVAVADDDGGGDTTTSPADDVLTAQADLPDELWSARCEGNVVLRLEPATIGDSHPGAWADLAEQLARFDEVHDQGRDPRVLRNVVIAWLVRSGLASTSVMARAASELLASGARSDVVVHMELIPEPEDEQSARVSRVLIIDRRRATVDEGLRQVWTHGTQAVTLDAHQHAVAARALSLATSLGLSAAAGETLRLAGAHHDDGKSDERFQARLGSRGDVLLAKSRPGISSHQARRNEARSELPAGWRHEQRSVVASWRQVHHHDVDDPWLVARLIGTSHGHGRVGFPHLTKGLLRSTDADELSSTAREVFDQGTWDQLIERTQETYGVWGCAYLEALLRAADGQVSEEGS